MALRSTATPTRGLARLLTFDGEAAVDFASNQDALGLETDDVCRAPSAEVGQDRLGGLETVAVPAKLVPVEQPLHVNLGQHGDG